MGYLQKMFYSEDVQEEGKGNKKNHISTPYGSSGPLGLKLVLSQNESSYGIEGPSKLNFTHLL